METPVLSEKLQKKTLSAKKAQKPTIKNILGCPYHNYWPLLNVEESKHLGEVLVDNLPPLNRAKVNVPWATIKNVAKEHRKEFRGSYKKTDTTIKSPQLLFGVNEVTRHLEKGQNGNIASVFIASDVSPQLMVRHIVDMCVINKVPVLVVRDLREVLKSSVGFGAVVMAISDTDDANLKAIITVVRELNCSYPVGETNFNYKRHTSGQTTSDKQVEMDEIAITNIEEVETHPKNFYLYRKSTLERAFVPVLSHSLTKGGDEMDVDSNSFVALDGSSKSNFRPLIVKRIKSNKNRNKMKIERMKMKKHQ